MFKGVIELKVKEMVDWEKKRIEIDDKETEKIVKDKIIKDGGDSVKVKEATEWVNNYHKNLANDQNERNKMVRSITTSQKQIRDLQDVAAALKKEKEEHERLECNDKKESKVNKEILLETEKWTKANEVIQT